MKFEDDLGNKFDDRNYLFYLFIMKKLFKVTVGIRVLVLILDLI